MDSLLHVKQSCFDFLLYQSNISKLCKNNNSIVRRQHKQLNLISNSIYYVWNRIYHIRYKMRLQNFKVDFYTGYLAWGPSLYFSDLALIISPQTVDSYWDISCTDQGEPSFKRNNLSFQSFEKWCYDRFKRKWEAPISDNIGYDLSHLNLKCSIISAFSS